LLDKINYYLAHDEERKRIAVAARERVIRDHTWTDRVKQMIQLMNELK
jgi:spore maturation protein CgeB